MPAHVSLLIEHDRDAQTGISAVAESQAQAGVSAVRLIEVVER